MINIYEVFETNKMIEKENLDVRTITMGSIVPTPTSTFSVKTSMTRSAVWPKTW